MERLDKVIGNCTSYTRSEIKKLVSKRLIMVNDKVITNSNYKVDVNLDKICINGEEVSFKKYIYLVLNKPKGYVSATKDREMKTVLDLVPEKYLYRNLFPVGRLDRDTTGLMIISDDGDFAHEVLSPKKHVKKVYEVLIDIPMTEEMVHGFKDGVLLNDGVCKGASLEIVGECEGIVTLEEGRYHQIKRMFGCYGAKVLELKRIGMGKFYLPSDLEEGITRELTEEEVLLIREKGK